MVVIDRIRTVFRSKSVSRGAIALSLVLGLSSVSWIVWSRLKTPEKQIEQIDLLSLYREQVIPSYKKKAAELIALQKELKSVDPQVSGILTHMPHWKVENLQELEQIEELASHLDTHVSNWYLMNREKIGRAEMSRTRWTKVANLDRQLDLTRRKLGLSPSPK